MSGFVRWNSQGLDAWARRYAQGRFIDLGGHSTHYVERGSGDPVILLHGFFYDSFLWSDNMDALAEEFRVFALDLWGFGYSTRESLDFGYRLYADQLRLFMDSMGIRSASLVGQSMGGGTSILFCAEHPERVDKLLLVDPAGMPNPLPPTGKFFNLPHVGEFFQGLRTNAVRKINLRRFWVHDKKLLTKEYVENVTRFQKIEGTTEVLLEVLRRQFFDKLSGEINRLAGIDVPILIVWGREDRAVPLDRGMKMHEILQGSRFEIIDGAGHVPNSERPDEFNRLALDFLRG